MSQDTKLTPQRLFWLCIGFICVGCGALGVFVPLLPTTVFMIVAAYAFARSSERFHTWLITHAVFGRLIRDWSEHGVVSKKAKWMSSLSMIIIVLLSIFLKAPNWLIILQLIVLGTVAIFLISRPSAVKDS